MFGGSSKQHMFFSVFLLYWHQTPKKTAEINSFSALVYLLTIKPHEFRDFFRNPSQEASPPLPCELLKVHHHEGGSVAGEGLSSSS